jgi:hypothetical protein
MVDSPTASWCCGRERHGWCGCLVRIMSARSGPREIALRTCTCSRRVDVSQLLRRHETIYPPATRAPCARHTLLDRAILAAWTLLLRLSWTTARHCGVRQPHHPVTTEGTQSPRGACWRTLTKIHRVSHRDTLHTCSSRLAVPSSRSSNSLGATPHTTSIFSTASTLQT